MTLKEQILALRENGFSYNQIEKELNCSKGTISYYLGQNQKEKANERRRKRHAKDTLIKKTDTFKNDKKGLNNKFTHFKSKGNGQYNFTYLDVKNLVGSNPICYLTGDQIDLSDPSSYHFDHIIPVSRGGDNSLANLGIASREANLAKNNMTIPELIELCYKIIEHFENNPY